MAIAISLLAAALSWAQVQIKPAAEGFTAEIAGQEFAHFDAGKTHSRPFFREIRAADGTILTRSISPPGGDHPHHTGVWVAVDKVNDVAFWHQEGQIKNETIEIVQSSTSPAMVHLTNDWLGLDGALLLKESTDIHIFANRLLAYEIRFTAGEQPVTFGDTEEGFFAFRMVDSMCEEATGKVENASGIRTAKGCWGKTSPWVDYSGQIEGKKYSVAIFDHPLNFRPSRYHVRDYGLCTISPFGESDYTKGELPASPVTLEPGSSFNLHYAMYFHDGDVDSGGVAEVYEEYLEATGFPTAEEREVQYRSSADGTFQPAMFFAPHSEAPVPLLVALHTWSDDYRQQYHAECLQWCRDKGWAYIHPNFRGPNRRPEATGSELVVQDIVDAVEYAKGHANVDSSRIYLIGTSGGGYTSLLMVGRHPELWAGVSSWVPIADLTRWYVQNKAAADKHWREVATSCGGPPGASEAVDRQYRLRSPITWLERARGIPLDINAGIRDGHEGSVPVSHSLQAFNKVARAEDRLSDKDIDYFARKAQVPPHLQRKIEDSTYGEKRPLFRRQSDAVRVTLFDGGHELIAQAGLQWLQQQRQSATEQLQPADEPAVQR